MLIIVIIISSINYCCIHNVRCDGHNNYCRLDQKYIINDIGISSHMFVIINYEIYTRKMVYLTIFISRKDPTKNILKTFT